MQVAHPSGVLARPLPTQPEAQALARELLGDEGTRLEHVLTAGRVAGRLAVLFDDPEAAHLLVVAATLHDIGYSRRIRRTGFHPLDAGEFLLAEGYPPELARLVANHSLAHLHAGDHVEELAQRFPPMPGLLADALAYADMHSSPTGHLIATEHRLADIAARHPTREHEERAAALRVVITRVGDALLAAPRPAGRARPAYRSSNR